MISAFAACFTMAVAVFLFNSLYFLLAGSRSVQHSNCFAVFSRFVLDSCVIALACAAGAGKTSLLWRFCEDQFNEYPINTIGVDFKIKTTWVCGKVLKFS